MVENQDLVSSIQYFRDGKLNLVEFLTSFNGVKELTWLALDDPKPFLKICSGLVKKSLGISKLTLTTNGYVFGTQLLNLLDNYSTNYLI
jgi:hypothetical protein